MYHVSQRTGVDVSMMNAAVFSIGVFPVCRTVVMFTKPPSFFSTYYGTKHIYTPDQFRPGYDPVWIPVEFSLSSLKLV